MDYQTILYFMMLTVFVSYVLFIWIKYGVLPSISESYYVLPEKYNFLFTFFCWGFAIPAIIIGDSALMFLAGSGIAFVGAAAAFKQKMTKTVHYIGAGVGILASQLSIIFEYYMLDVTIMFIILSIILALIDKKHAIWWTEILAFLSICYVFGTYLF